MKPEIVNKPIHDAQDLSAWQAQELLSERDKNIWRTKHYVLPLLERVFAGKDKSKISILSVGCGNGEEIDTITEHGFQGIGVDPGYRIVEWKLRGHKDRFFVAKGEELPFRDEAFDLVLSFGVIEHVGAIGDTVKVNPDYQRKRRLFAKEMLRVTKKDGFILMATPNKRFPLDMWHGPFLWGVRFHSVREKFLLSLSELHSLFLGSGKCRNARLLTLDNFFQYKKVGQHFWIRIILFPIQLMMKLISRYDFLKRSFLNPFLIILYTK